MTDKQAQIWQDIVDTEPGGWFRPSEEPLLVAYCRHVVSADWVSKQIDAFNFESGELKVMDRLLRMRERETRALSSLATRMRFTQQARMHPRTTGRAEDGPQGGRKLWERRPWDDD